MTTLTLPIVVGKKYVRRDGAVIQATPSRHGDDWVRVNHDEPVETNGCSVRVNHGGVWSIGEAKHDLVSDYIEPAKGHPHAALMMEFAKDAAEFERPWELWQVKRTVCEGEEAEWESMNIADAFWPSCEFRRRPTVTPDPHAENAAEYAKDMALSDKAWEGWEYRHQDSRQWGTCTGHPQWFSNLQYRRKEQS